MGACFTVEEVGRLEEEYGIRFKFRPPTDRLIEADESAWLMPNGLELVVTWPLRAGGRVGEIVAEMREVFEEWELVRRLFARSAAQRLAIVG